MLITPKLVSLHLSPSPNWKVAFLFFIFFPFGVIYFLVSPHEGAHSKNFAKVEYTLPLLLVLITNILNDLTRKFKNIIDFFSTTQIQTKGKWKCLQSVTEQHAQKIALSSKEVIIIYAWNVNKKEKVKKKTTFKLGKKINATQNKRTSQNLYVINIPLFVRSKYFHPNKKSQHFIARIGKKSKLLIDKL